jgi:hypothetical protein
MLSANRQTPPPWPRPQGLQAHQPFDPVQIAFDTVCQKVSPAAPCAAGPVAGKAFTCWPIASVLPDLALGDRFSQAWKPDRDTPIASPCHRPDIPLLREWPPTSIAEP